jgi:hypothetical protein
LSGRRATPPLKVSRPVRVLTAMGGRADGICVLKWDVDQQHGVLQLWPLLEWGQLPLCPVREI